MLLFPSMRATCFGHYWPSSGIKYIIFKTQNQKHIYNFWDLTKFSALTGDRPCSLWDRNLIFISIFLRKLSYLKGIYQVHYNERANDCHGTPFQPTCRIIADLENDCPSCRSCFCHRYQLSGSSATQLVFLRRLYSNIKKKKRVLQRIGFSGWLWWTW